MEEQVKQEKRRRKKKRLWVVRFFKKYILNVKKTRYDYILLFSMLCLIVFGLIMIYSVTNYEDLVVREDSFYSVKKQLFFLGIGMLLLLIVSRIDYHLWVKNAFIIFSASILLVIFTMMFGVESNGQKRWIVLFGVQFQTSELVKPAIILLLSRYLTVKYKPKKRNVKNFNFAYFFWGMVITAIPFVLIMRTNLSTAIIIFCIGYCMIALASKTKGLYIFMAASGVLGLVVAWKLGIIQYFLNENRLLRVYAWLEPEKYKNSGYQILQSLYAISSGGLFGKGLGCSVQKLGFLPEAQNDMIFAIICEELGICGAIITMVLFAILFMRIKKVADEAKDMAGFMIASGTMAHLMIQTIFNICVAANVMPNTGVTLPFISYGGTALVCTLLELGLVVAVDIQSPKQIEAEKE